LRRRRREHRGAKGAEWGIGYGEGCPLPSQLGDLGERRELPSGVLGGAPAAIAFSAYGHRNLELLKKLQIPLLKKWW